MMVTATIGAPSASARFNLEPTPGPSNPSTAVVSQVDHTSGGVAPSQPGSSDFDWADAGIGAAGTLVLLGLGASGIAVRRTRGRHAAAS
jgi:hypothetical protein